MLDLASLIMTCIFFFTLLLFYWNISLKHNFLHPVRPLVRVLLKNMAFFSSPVKVLLDLNHFRHHVLQKLQPFFLFSQEKDFHCIYLQTQGIFFFMTGSANLYVAALASLTPIKMSFITHKYIQRHVPPPLMLSPENTTKLGFSLSSTLFM